MREAGAREATAISFALLIHSQRSCFTVQATNVNRRSALGQLRNETQRLCRALEAEAALR